MNFYEYLGVSKNATAEEIKKAYRSKAREHHPDMHRGEEEQKKHAEIFKVVVEAFEVLSDPIKRSQYDMRGYYGKRPSSPPPPPPQQNKPKQKEDFERERAEKKKQESAFKKTYDTEPTHVNCSFFGGGASGRSILVHIKLTPQEYKNGCSKSVTIKKRDFCIVCGGDGQGTFQCPTCRNNKHQKWVCPTCDYTGEINGKCPFCKGIGTGKWILEEIHFKVSPNTQPGHAINVLGQGETAARKPPGNVRIVLV